MSNFHRKDVKQMSIQELEDYIRKNSIINQQNFNNNYNLENIRINDNNSHNFNYQLPDRDNNEEIEKLIKENQELKNDLNQLFYLTDQNKNELEIKIKDLSEENCSLKQQINELKSKILFQQNILSNSELDKNEILNEKKIMQEKYEKEIFELNNQLNHYKSKISSLNIEYHSLLENFHQLKQDYAIQNIIKNNNYEENKQSTIEEVRNLKEYLLINNNNIQEIKKKLNNIEQMTITDLNKSIKSLKKSSSLVNNKTYRNSKSKLLKKNLSRNNNFKPNQNLIKNNYKSQINKLSISPKNFSTSLNKLETNYSSQVIDEEIFSLERKVADLNISYQSFLKKLTKNPNDSNNECNNLKKNLKFLQDTICENNNKLKELKNKQKQILIRSAMDIY